MDRHPNRYIARGAQASAPIYRYTLVRHYPSPAGGRQTAARIHLVHTPAMNNLSRNVQIASFWPLSHPLSPRRNHAQNAVNLIPPLEADRAH